MNIYFCLLYFDRLLTHVVKAVKNSFFKRENIEKMLEQHCQMKADNSYPLWALLVFEIWFSEDL